MHVYTVCILRCKCIYVYIMSMYIYIYVYMHIIHMKSRHVTIKHCLVDLAFELSHQLEIY